MRAANLLPWRQQRQRRCLRLWGLLYGGSLLLVLGLALNVRANSQLAQSELRQWHDSDRALRQAIEQRKKGWLALRHQRQQQARWEQRKAATRAWQPLLTALADALPAQAWLTRLRFQQSVLYLSGCAATPGALSGLEKSLGQLPGFALKPAGEMRQQAPGCWQFNYALAQQEAPDAEPS